MDLVILCLPDDAAKETVALIDSMGAEAPKVLDASTAFRVARDWAYGFPELTPDQADKIRAARYNAETQGAKLELLARFHAGPGWAAPGGRVIAGARQRISDTHDE